MANDKINNPLVNNPAVPTATVAPTAPSVPVASNNPVTRSAMNNTNAINGVNNQYGVGFNAKNPNPNYLQSLGISDDYNGADSIGKLIANNPDIYNKTPIDYANIDISKDPRYANFGVLDGLKFWKDAATNFNLDNFLSNFQRNEIIPANNGGVKNTNPNIVIQPKGAMQTAAEKFTYNPVNVNNTNAELTQNAPNTNFDIGNVLKQIYAAQNMAGKTDLTNTGNLFNALQGQNSNQADNLEAQRQQLLAKLGQGESNLNNFLNNYKNSDSLSSLIASKFQISNQASNNKILESLLGNILQNSIQNNQNATDRLNSNALGYQNSSDEKDAAFKQSLAGILPQTQARANLNQLSNNLAITQNRDKIATNPNDQATSYKLNAMKTSIDLNNRLMNLDEKDPKQAFEAEQIRNQLNTLGQLTGMVNNSGKPQIEKINTYDPITGQVNGQKLVQINQRKVNGQYVPEYIDLQPNNGPSLQDLVAKMQEKGASKEDIEKAKAIADKNAKK